MTVRCRQSNCPDITKMRHDEQLLCFYVDPAPDEKQRTCRAVV